ncbi:hypothetical protein EIP91_006603 [Steccherinum ochraceum]|uniref:Uncharacterized protein n=1 Tax=Steccherinum ochraceum TaxID=92696 RepID=A0A4R0R5D5_9APHY|nr:hypothetical protein EIP91_006603 [Steccherinum ochraceum]
MFQSTDTPASECSSSDVACGSERTPSPHGAGAQPTVVEELTALSDATFDVIDNVAGELTSTIRSEEHDLDHDNNAQGDRAALLAMLEGAEDGAGELELVGGSQKAASGFLGDSCLDMRLCQSSQLGQKCPLANNGTKSVSSGTAPKLGKRISERPVSAVPGERKSAIDSDD